MSDHVLAIMKTKQTYEEKMDLFLEYLKCLNKTEYDFFDIEQMTMNRAQREQFIDNIEKDGIYVHQPPFFGNTTEEQFKTIFKEHPEWCTEYKFKGIEKPMTMGDIYFIRLKHESANKMSVRSAANLNVKNLPAKSNLKKDKKIAYSTTPIRLGEMEVTNLLLAKSPETVEKMLKTYSTNEDLRESTIEQLLAPGKGKDALNMDLSVDLKNNYSVSHDILEKYLNVLGFSLIDNQNENK